MSSIELVYYRLLSREITLSEFETWVYTEPALETLLTSDDYLDLLSINYHHPDGSYKAEKILSRYFSLGKYYEWVLRNILNKIVEKPENVHLYIRQCYEMYCDGFNFLDNLGIGYGLDIVCQDSEMVQVDDYYPQILNEAKKVIRWLDTGKIIITGHSGAYQGIEYRDNRSESEKEPTAYKIAKNNTKWWQFWLRP